MRRVLILGAGCLGLAAALGLALRDHAHDTVVCDDARLVDSGLDDWPHGKWYLPRCNRWGPMPGEELCEEDFVADSAVEWLAILITSYILLAGTGSFRTVKDGVWDEPITQIKA